MGRIASSHKMQLGYAKIGGGVPCPKCEGESSCLDTFWSTTFDGVGRRRLCKSCNHMFYTVEKQVELKHDQAIKRREA